jgi:Transposase DDE domain.
MRKRFEAQFSLGSTPIQDIRIPTKSRDEFPPFLRAMQYIYCDSDLNEQVFSMLESKICIKQKTGRLGMDLWSIFVLGGARLCLNADYDRLFYLSNYDLLLRQMLGVQDGIVRGRDFDRQTIIDNVSLLDDELLKEINLLIVEAGHGILKKKETEALRLKVDSFVTETNVHFPTDYNLLWDSARKCLDVLSSLVERGSNHGKGWRKIEFWRRSLKNAMLTLSRATADKSKNKPERLKKAAVEYLRVATGLQEKIKAFINGNSFHDTGEYVLLLELQNYLALLEKHANLVDRRLLHGEIIPAGEKLYSIFEQHTEWICKGKRHKPVELGKRTLIATDQYHFIVDYHVADHQQDVDLLVPCMDRVLQRFSIDSCSCDRGFFSKDNVDIMELFSIKAIIPKRGKKSQVDLQKESEPFFVKSRARHSAIESNINELEHRGLDRCPDKGLRGLTRYVGLAVIAYNLCRIGRVLLERDRELFARARLAA